MYSGIITSVFFTTWIIERIYYYKKKHNQENQSPGLLKLNIPLNTTDTSPYVPVDPDNFKKNTNTTNVNTTIL